MSDEPRKQPEQAPDARPATPEQHTTPLPAPSSTDEARAEAQPTVEQPRPVETATAADAPPPPPVPPVQPVAAAGPGRFGRFTRHRATQIVAAGLAGLLIGGGVVALVDNDHGRPGFSTRGDARGGFGPGDRGHGDRGYFRDGPGPRQQFPRRDQLPPQRQQPTTPSTPPSSTTTPS